MEQEKLSVGEAPTGQRNESRGGGLERHQPQPQKKMYGKINTANRQRPGGEARSLEETPARSDDNQEESKSEKTSMPGRLGKAPATMPK